MLSHNFGDNDKRSYALRTATLPRRLYQKKNPTKREALWGFGAESAKARQDAYHLVIGRDDSRVPESAAIASSTVAARW